MRVHIASTKIMGASWADRNGGLFIPERRRLHMEVHNFLTICDTPQTVARTTVANEAEARRTPPYLLTSLQPAGARVTMTLAQITTIKTTLLGKTCVKIIHDEFDYNSDRQ